MRYRTTILGTGQNTTGIPVPPEVVEALGAGKRPPVRVTVGGHTYRSSIATMDGTPMISLSAENRAAAGVAAGDQVDVDVELDTQPREVTVPPALAEALARDPEAKAVFDSLSYSRRLRYALDVEGAKTPETLARRVEKTMDSLRAGGR
jgi:hypothetical protein